MLEMRILAVTQRDSIKAKKTSSAPTKHVKASRVVAAQSLMLPHCWPTSMKKFNVF